MRNPSFSRRDFLAAGTAVTAAAMTAKSYAQILGANQRINVGLIGVGGMGTNHLNALMKLAEPNNMRLLSIADCWKKRADDAAAKAGDSHSVQDYREMLDDKIIDYVTIATPEHRHAEIVLDALDAGKHVYCEKPLTHTIPEALEVQVKVKQTGLALQVGVQGMSDDSYESAGKAIRDGVIGLVVQAQIEYVRRNGKLGPWRDPDLDGDMPKPDDLDWHKWLGPATDVPWNPHHYFEWRSYAAYSGGIVSDLFIHRLSRIMKACDLLYPDRVVGMGGIRQWPDGRTLPDNFEMICEYPRGMTVYVLGTMSNRHGLEHCIRGYRGTLFFTKEGWVARDKDDKVLAEHKKTGAEDIHLHHTNLHNHLRNGESLNCPVDFAVAGVVAGCMAIESHRSGRMMAWDAEQQGMVSAENLSQSPALEKVGS